MDDSLFFKVFRNKFLFSKIFSNFKQRYGSLLYDQVTSVHFMLKNSYIDLLLYKVKNKEHLSFSSKIQDIYGPAFKSYKNPIFNLKYKEYKQSKESLKEKEDKLDINFYNDYFNNYYFGLNSEIINKDKILNLVNSLIVYDNINALRSVIENFNRFKISKNEDALFITSLKFNSFKIANYIYSKINKSINKSTVWKSIFQMIFDSQIDAIKINEILNYLIKELKFEKPSTELNSFKKKQQKINKSSKHNQVVLPTFKYQINYLICDQSVQSLINSCFSIITLELNNNYSYLLEEKKSFFSNEVNNDRLLNSYFKESFQMLSLEQLNEIQSQFSKLQLSTKLYNLLENEEFRISDDNSTTIANNSIEKLIKMLLPFLENHSIHNNYFFYLVMFKNDKESKQVAKESLINTDEIFFKYCNSRMDIQVEFLNDYLMTNRGDDNFYTKLINILDLLIFLNSNKVLINIVLQFLQATKNGEQINNNNTEYQQINPDHIFNCFYKVFPNKIYILNWYKLNYPKEFKENVKRIIFDPTIEYKKEAIQFLVNNHQYIPDIKRTLLELYLSLSSKESYKSLIESSLSDRNCLKMIFKFGISRSLPLLYYFNNPNNVDEIFKVENFSNNCGLLTKHTDINTYIPFFNEGAKRGDLRPIEFILSLPIDLIRHYLLFSVHYGQSSVFEYIHKSEHHKILKEYCQHLTKRAIECKHYNILNYFKNVIKFNNFKNKNIIELSN